MTVRRELTATGSAMNSLHMDPGRFLYDDGHTMSCPTGVRKTQGVRRAGGRAATSQDAGSYTRQEGCPLTPAEKSAACLITFTDARTLNLTLLAIYPARDQCSF